MFFQIKQRPSRKYCGVLRAGGTYLFVLWDNWKEMPAALALAADVVGEMLGR